MFLILVRPQHVGGHDFPDALSKQFPPPETCFLPVYERSWTWPVYTARYRLLRFDPPSVIRGKACPIWRESLTAHPMPLTWRSSRASAPAHSVTSGEGIFCGARRLLMISPWWRRPGILSGLCSRALESAPYKRLPRGRARMCSAATCRWPASGIRKNGSPEAHSGPDARSIRRCVTRLDADNSICTGDPTGRAHYRSQSGVGRPFSRKNAGFHSLPW